MNSQSSRNETAAAAVNGSDSTAAAPRDRKPGGGVLKRLKSRRNQVDRRPVTEEELRALGRDITPDEVLGLRVITRGKSSDTALWDLLHLTTPKMLLVCTYYELQHVLTSCVCLLYTGNTFQWVYRKHFVFMSILTIANKQSTLGHASCLAVWEHCYIAFLFTLIQSPPEINNYCLSTILLPMFHYWSAWYIFPPQTICVNQRTTSTTLTSHGLRSETWRRGWSFLRLPNRHSVVCLFSS